MTKKFEILIIDDDAVLRSSLADHLEDMGVVEKITFAENGKRGAHWIEQSDFDLVFLDIDLPFKTGMEVLRETISKKPYITFILMTAYGRIPDAVEAIKLGAYTYLEKPLKPKSLEKLINEVIEAKFLVESLKNLSPIAFESGKELIGATPELKDIMLLVQKVARVNTPVLIQGESGTGKELVARAIHYNSPRKSSKFVTVNCSAIVTTLFESEFFGHEKGSFTGADEKKIGKLQYAEGGTLFLDEIGDLSLDNQVKLLRVLQEKKFTPVGSNLEIPYDVRILTATHRDLENMVEEERFRQDLFFRLNVLNFKIPSLKERQVDIPDLVRNFIERFNKKHNMEILGWKPEFLQKLLNYDFPGNIRELENIIERAIVLTEGKWLEVGYLPLSFNEGLKKDEEPLEVVLENPNDPQPEIKINSEDLDFQKNKEEFEKKFIIEALKRNEGRLNQTALEANIPKKTLQRKIQKYGIDIKDFKK